MRYGTMLQIDLSENTIEAKVGLAKMAARSLRCLEFTAS